MKLKLIKANHWFRIKQISDLQPIARTPNKGEKKNLSSWFVLFCFFKPSHQLTLILIPIGQHFANVGSLNPAKTNCKHLSIGLPLCYQVKHNSLFYAGDENKKWQIAVWPSRVTGKGVQVLLAGSSSKFPRWHETAATVWWSEEIRRAIHSPSNTVSRKPHAPE